MKDKAYTQPDSKYEGIQLNFKCILAYLCLILKFCSEINIRPMATVEYKGNFII